MTLENLRRDIAYAIRGLRSKPGFTIAVVITLALGIGANAAMFGIVDRLLLRPPPLLKDPATAHRVYVWDTYRGKQLTGWVGRYARWRDLDSTTTSFEYTAGYTARDLGVGVGEEARVMPVGAVSADFFRFFNAPPALGRYFTRDEDAPPDGSAVVVLSWPMWQAQYGGRADAIGSTIRVDADIYTVIGVTPRGFTGLTPEKPPAMYIPIARYGASQNCAGRGTTWYETYSCGWMQMIARRRADVSIEAANADLTHAYQLSYAKQRIEMPRATPPEIDKPHATVGSILAQRGPNASATTKVAAWVGGVSVIVLLIACANVANLLLARALRRRREIAVRLALGITRARLISQLLTESIILALIGGVAGLLVAHWGGAVLRATLLEQDSQAPAGLRDPRTVLFALGAAIVVGLLTGLAPILQASRTNLNADLKAGAREGHAHSPARTLLLVLQGALSVVLLVGAALFVRSLENVHALRLGYDVDPVLLVNLNMRGEELDSARSVQLRERLLQAATALPGVESATRQTAVPFWSNSSTALFVEGIDTVSRLGQFDYAAVSPSHFRTVGTRLLRGRGIETHDVATSQRVMVVSDAMGKVLWPGRDPIGQCIRVQADTMPCTWVVGIAENIREQQLLSDSGYFYYVPISQFRSQSGGLFVRARHDADDIREPLRRTLQREMPGAAYVTVTPFSEIVSPETRSWQLGATMFVAFGLLALVLAAVGLYSVIAYNVTQRTHEMGVRIALGARAADVARLVVGEALRVGAIGIAIGVVLALWATRWVKPLLYDVSPTEPGIYIVVGLTLLSVAVLASWVPARRATRVDPNVALRAE
ncbi:MAG TPA: ABC transporter permease [Gemmatimonadaceae bacterium]